jgi:hypothetical protein
MNEMLQELLPVLGSAVGAVLAGFAVQIARRVSQKYGLQVEAAQEAKIEMAVRRGVAYAEEKARQQLKQTPMSGPDKLSTAVEHAMRFVPKADATKIAETAMAVLPEMRQAELSGAQVPPGKA